MMGSRPEAQAALFYEFSLEDHVPRDHLLRSIDRFVDLSSIRSHLADFYSHTGRPSVDPELLIRMLLVSYCFGIRSERRLCEEVHLNLAYRWFCRLDLTDRVPEHSAFSKNRHGRFRESELLRHVFETTVARCIAEGLVSGQRMAIDASLIEAEATKQYSTSQEEWDVARIDADTAPRAVREYLDTLDDAAFGAASPVKPKFTSYSDPASQWTAAHKAPALYGDSVVKGVVSPSLFLGLRKVRGSHLPRNASRVTALYSVDLISDRNHDAFMDTLAPGRSLGKEDSMT